jgi:hypothetical protein
MRRGLVGNAASGAAYQAGTLGAIPNMNMVYRIFDETLVFIFNNLDVRGIGFEAVLFRELNWETKKSTPV